jgi:glyoxylase-like metal-dependent hydrolase (beta-lactamase superfamily II)
VLTVVHRIDDLLANAFLLEGEELVLVDTGWPGRHSSILEGVRRAGFRPADIGHIILTHHHPDHAGNAAELKKAAGARLLAHPADAPFIEGAEAQPVGSPICLTGRFLAAHPRVARRWMGHPPAEVDGALEEGAEVPGLPGTSVMHTPGHTPGSISLHNPGEGWILVGDAVSHMFGALWLPTLSFSSDLGDIFRSIERIADTGAERVFFGHGPTLQGNACARLRRFAKLRARLRRS